ncbi:MAG: hypothetical protein H6823_11135 [Planctomycetaceae bacterium]|nr:hypothetical protein [Planctomycetales bacterium]MCB9938788.1 hypothetical protein [Planctomycetaceae bacterium]
MPVLLGATIEVGSGVRENSSLGDVVSDGRDVARVTRSLACLLGGVIVAGVGGSASA